MVDVLAASGLGAIFGAFAALGIIIFLGLYVYSALAWSAIAKKLKYEYHWLAWIPIVQLVLLPILAEKEWPWVFIMLVPIVNFVFLIMWTWKIYERRNLPGALSLIYIGAFIPFVNWIAAIANLVILGIAAWRD